MIALEHTQAAHCLLTAELSPPDLHLNLANERAPRNLAVSFSSTLQSAATFTNLKIETHGIVCFCQTQIGLGFSGVQFVPHAALFFSLLFPHFENRASPERRQIGWAGLTIVLSHTEGQVMGLTSCCFPKRSVAS